MVYDVLDIANKIIRHIDDKHCGDVVTNLKLQKLLYYQQGFHIAVFGKPLFENDIEAWMYGPVVPFVYEHYRVNGNSPLPSRDDVVRLTDEEEDVFNEVMRVYGDYSAIGLMNLTHKEAPWRETKVGVGNVIPRESMKKFFKKKIK